MFAEGRKEMYFIWILCKQLRWSHFHFIWNVFWQFFFLHLHWTHFECRFYYWIRSSCCWKLWSIVHGASFSFRLKLLPNPLPSKNIARNESRTKLTKSALIESNSRFVDDFNRSELNSTQFSPAHDHPIRNNSGYNRMTLSSTFYMCTNVSCDGANNGKALLWSMTAFMTVLACSDWLYEQ